MTIQSPVLDLCLHLINLRNGGGLDHSRDVVDWSLKLAKAAGLDKNQQFMIDLEVAARIHDIGKLGLPDAVISKPGRLTESERIIINTHSLEGEKTLRFFVAICGGDDVINANVLRNVKHHHENWDGTGYPDKLKGDEIPTGSQIIRLADSNSAMLSSYRPARPVMTQEEAIKDLLRVRKRYSPVLLPIFIALLEEDK
jgi:HD-GYP domain-containing protein (c-di-GMP phosphodiesterase class II)